MTGRQEEKNRAPAAAAHDLPEPDLRSVADPLFDGVEAVPVEQIGGMYGMPSGPQELGEPLDARGQPQCVVE